MKKTKVEVEGGELLLMSDEGHYAVISAKHRREAMDMVTERCDDCVNEYIKTLPKESDYAEDGSLYGEPDKKSNEENTSANYLEEKRKSYLSYMAHPKYKERLNMEMFGKPIIENDENSNKSLNAEYESRLKNINELQFKEEPSKVFATGEYSPYDHTLAISEKYYSWLKDNSANTPEGIKGVQDQKALTTYHELSHSAERGHLDVNRMQGFGKEYSKYVQPHLAEILTSNSITKGDLINKWKELSEKWKDLNITDDHYHEKIILGKIWNASDIGKRYDFLNKKLMNNTISDEEWDEYKKILKTEESFGKDMKDMDDMYQKHTFTNIWDRASYPNPEYYSKPTEVKARLNALRLKAIEDGKYDQNDEFDIRKYEYLKENSNYQDLIKHLKLTDDDINKLMKYVAEINISDLNRLHS